MNRLTRTRTIPQAASPQETGTGSSFYRRAFLRTFGRMECGSLLVDEAYSEAGSEAHSATTTRLGPGTDDELRATVRIVDPTFFKAVALRGSVGAAEAWIDGLWDSPDLEAVIRVMLRNRDTLDGMGRGMGRGIARAARWILRRLDRFHANTRAGSRRNIAAHYDLGNDFFSAFLDPSMTYSSAIFDAEHQSLEAAQRNKLDRLCRKLDLRSTDHVLEIGTGWGSFAIYAARRYGCRVTTTTISREQFTEARRRIENAGLSDWITVLLEDYRDLEGQFDKLASIEMVEAVGDTYLETWFGACSRLLAPHGVMAFQAITITDQHFAASLRDVDFIKRYIFPGSFIPSATRLIDVATKATDMRMIHMEDFGTHYAATLRQWKRNLHDAPSLPENLTPAFLRMWNYYLDYCAGGFAERFLGVCQLVFRKPRALTEPILGDLS